MKRFVFVLLISLAGVTSAAEQTPLASGQQLKNAIAGNTVQGSMDGAGRYTEFYAKDGTVRSKDYQAKWSIEGCLLYTSPSPRDRQKSRMPSSA